MSTIHAHESNKYTLHIRLTNFRLIYILLFYIPFTSTYFTYLQRAKHQHARCLFSWCFLKQQGTPTNNPY
mgnify:CR=1 FL=1